MGIKKTIYNAQSNVPLLFLDARYYTLCHK